MLQRLTIRQFKEMVQADLRIAMTGRELRRIAAQEVGQGRITSGCDVAQVALARCLREGDAYVSTDMDLTVGIARRTTTVSSFFNTLFSDTEKLRQSVRAGSLSMAVGMALGDRTGLTVCTIGGEFIADGEFFEALSYASAHSLPLAIVIWNNDGAHTNGNLIRQLSGFGSNVRGGRTLTVEAVKGYDYPALCHVFEEQVTRSRKGAATLTLVEAGRDDIEGLRSWLDEKQIASSEQMEELSAAVSKEVDRSRKTAYYSSLVADTPIPTSVASLIDLSSLTMPTDTRVVSLPHMPEVVNKAVGVGRRGQIVVADIGRSSLDGNLLSSYSETHVILRSTTISAGYALAMTSEKVSVLTPYMNHEIMAAYKELLGRVCQAVVIETKGPTEKESHQTGEGIWEAHVLSEGEDLTVVSFGSTTEATADAVRMMASHNIRAEHIYLTALRPLDPTGAILRSIRKTKRLLVVDPDELSRAARYVISELATRETGLRHLLAAPVVAHARSGKQQIEPQDICRAAGTAVG